MKNKSHLQDDEEEEEMKIETVQNWLRYIYVYLSRNFFSVNFCLDVRSAYETLFGDLINVAFTLLNAAT